MIQPSFESRRRPAAGNEPSRVVLRSRRGLGPAAFVVLSGALASPAIATAQQECGPATAVPSLARQWPAPLDRVIAVRLRNVSLRDGLDRVAVTSRIRVSYSAELLPLDRRVCLSVDAIAAGDALAELLSGTGIEPVTTGSDQVVLAPARASGKPPQVTGSVQTLERVVVTGSATGDAQRPLTVALDVLDGKKLAEQSSSSLASTFDGSVPGLWVWEQSPTSLLARYGSIRGASSFGVSYPKVYIDGIEVANPLLVTDLNPAVLDHVEVIRGPQGAALYGADAISGVVNIVTRHEGTQAWRRSHRSGQRRGLLPIRLRIAVGLRAESCADLARRLEHALRIAGDEPLDAWRLRAAGLQPRSQAERRGASRDVEGRLRRHGAVLRQAGGRWRESAAAGVRAAARVPGVDARHGSGDDSRGARPERPRSPRSGHVARVGSRVHRRRHGDAVHLGALDAVVRRRPRRISAGERAGRSRARVIGDGHGAACRARGRRSRDAPRDGRRSV